MEIRSKGQSRRGKALLAGVVVVALLAGLVAPAAASRTGTVSWSGARAIWGNQTGNGYAWASLTEDFNTSRLRARVYYRASNGNYYWSSDGWDNDSYDSVQRSGEGINSKFQLDTNLSGTYGYIYKSF